MLRRGERRTAKSRRRGGGGDARGARSSEHTQSTAAATWRGKREQLRHRGAPTVAADEDEDKFVVGASTRSSTTCREARATTIGSPRAARASRTPMAPARPATPKDHDGAPGPTRARRRRAAARAKTARHDSRARGRKAPAPTTASPLFARAARDAPSSNAALEARVDAATERHAGAAPRVVVGQKEDDFVRLASRQRRPASRKATSSRSSRVRGSVGPDGDDAAQAVPPALRVAVAALFTHSAVARRSYIRATSFAGTQNSRAAAISRRVRWRRPCAPKPALPRAGRRAATSIERLRSSRHCGRPRRDGVRRPSPVDTLGRPALCAPLALRRRAAVDVAGRHGAEPGADVAPLAVRRLVRGCVPPAMLTAQSSSSSSAESGRAARAAARAAISNASSSSTAARAAVLPSRHGPAPPGRRALPACSRARMQPAARGDASLRLPRRPQQCLSFSRPLH